MADIMYLSFLANRFANIYSTPAIKQAERMQRLINNTNIHPFLNEAQRIKNLYNDPLIQHMKRMQDDINRLNIAPTINQIKRAQESYSNLAMTFIKAANTYKSVFSDLKYWIDMTTDIIQPFDSISTADDLEFSITDEYISATEDVLDNLQNAIPNDTEENQQAHNLIDSIKTALPSMNPDRILSIIQIILTILSFSFNIHQSNQSTIVSNTNTDNMIAVFDDNTDKTITAINANSNAVSELAVAINNYIEQQANTDSEQNERLDRLEKLAEQSESNND